MIGVGLVGFGFAGRTFHAPILSAVPGLALRAIVQRTGSDAAEKYPDSRIVRSIDELLSLEEIRLVVIATPNTTHFDLAKQVLMAGRDVVVDKPFTTTFTEAVELIELARSRRRLLSVYQNRRWDGDFQTVQTLVASGRLGRVVLFESHFDRFRPALRDSAWREKPVAGSGVLFDLGPHLLDQAFVLFGTPEAISADVRIEREHALVDDAFDIVLHYPRMRALLRAGMLVSTQTPRFAIQGSGAGYLKYSLDPQEDALKHGENPEGDTWGREGPERWGTLTIADAVGFEAQSYPTLPGDYRKYYANIRDALQGKQPLAVTPEQALHVMNALELARESSQKRCAISWRDKP